MYKPTAPDVSINDKDKNAFMSVVHQLDRTKGLDLVLHTPGGDIAATESIIDYLHNIFNGNIRAFIPQIAMSAGTMIALSCKEIIMGKQSCLGPIDPQINGLPCQAVLDEFENAKNDIKNNPHSLGLWQTIISKYHPTFLTTCQNAVNLSEDLAKTWIPKSQPQVDIEKILNKFLNHKESKTHSRHISAAECKNVGLNIIDMESDQNIQDLILSLHHCYMILIETTNVVKMVENQNGKSFIIQTPSNK
jgi:hypothetical protein